MDGNFLEQIKERLEKLEFAVFGDDHKDKILMPPNKKYSGAKGGILLLIDKNFFENIRRTASQVRTAMTEQGYNYSIQVVQTTLNRLSSRNGPLTAMKEGKIKVYARRK